MIETINYEPKIEVIKKEETVLFRLPEATISASFYWDAHGRKIPWEGPNGKKSMRLKGKNIEMRRVYKVEKWEYLPKPIETEMWHLYVDGKKVDMGEITSYNISSDRTAVKLKSCMGAG